MVRHSPAPVRSHRWPDECQIRWLVGVCHALMSFGTRCPALHRSGCFRPSDRLAGWDSHPLEIAGFHGVLGCPSILHQ